MSDVIHSTRPRKRSVAAGLSAVGAAAMLSGCDPTPSVEQLSRERHGEPTEVSAFQSVSECVASGPFSQVQCEEAQKTAQAEDDRAAPRFADKQTCEEQFGEASCQPRSQGGQSFFTPLLTGFMIGQLLNGGGSRYRYGGLYQDRRSGGYYTGSGAPLFNGGYGGRSTGYQIGNRALATPVTTQRIQTRSSVVSRGGFGGRASARSGGWGGGSRGG